MGETELSPDSGSPEILEGNGSPEEVYDSDRELREGFLEKGMFELYCKGPPELMRQWDGRGFQAKSCVWEAQSGR